MLRHRDNERPEQEVSLWLERNTLSEKYKKLQRHNKVVLRNLVCIPTRTTSPSQRKDLWKELCLPNIGRDLNPDDFVPPDEELKKFFTPVAPSETLSYFEKF